MMVLVEALVADIEKLGGVVHTNARVTGIASSDGGWIVRAEVAAGNRAALRLYHTLGFQAQPRRLPGLRRVLRLPV